MVELAARVRAGVPAAVARAITWCEAGRGAELLELLPRRTAQVVGITGPPGAGKSTLVSAMIGRLRAQGRTVGVIAVDPSSPLSGGALLGDRVRLDGAAGDRGVFFRSLASRGAAGGLSAAARDATTVLSAAGFDIVLLETVGAGQSEVEVVRVADTVVLVLNPGAGDEMQALKAGIMEIAAVYALNKADLAGAAELRSHVAAALRTREPSAWRPVYLPTVAARGTGVDALLDAIDRHWAHLHATGAAVIGDRATGIGGQADVDGAGGAVVGDGSARVVGAVTGDGAAGPGGAVVGDGSAPAGGAVIGDRASGAAVVGAGSTGSVSPGGAVVGDGSAGGRAVVDGITTAAIGDGTGDPADRSTGAAILRRAAALFRTAAAPHVAALAEDVAAGRCDEATAAARLVEIVSRDRHAT